MLHNIMFDLKTRPRPEVYSYEPARRDAPLLEYLKLEVINSR